MLCMRPVSCHGLPIVLFHSVFVLRLELGSERSQYWFFNRQYRYQALASPGVWMGGQEGRGVLGRTVKKGGTAVS